VHSRYCCICKATWPSCCRYENASACCSLCPARWSH